MVCDAGVVTGSCDRFFVVVCYSICNLGALEVAIYLNILLFSLLRWQYVLP